MTLSTATDYDRCFATLVTSGIAKKKTMLQFLVTICDLALSQPSPIALQAQSSAYAHTKDFT